MKIVQIGSYPLDSSYVKGGVEASVFGLALEQANGNEVFIFDLPRYEIKTDTIEQLHPTVVFRFSNKRKNNYFSLLRINKIIKEVQTLQPNICHIHTTSLFSLFIYIFLRLNRIPAIVTVHGLSHIEKQNIFYKQRNFKNWIKYISQSLTEFLFMSICPLIIVDTQYVAEAIRGYKKQHKILRFPKCKVIPQGVNEVFFQMENEFQEHHLLAIGAINKRKGHLLLIEVMQQVIMKYPTCTLSIAGVLSDQKYYETMQTQIKERKLEKNIRIYPNASFDEILKLYASAEVFVLHTEEESQGIVFCEAMAAGKPIVSTNVGGVPWVVENKINGLLCDYGDVDTFATNIITLLENENLRKKMEDINRTQSEKYNWTSIAKEIMKAYTTLI